MSDSQITNRHQRRKALAKVKNHIRTMASEIGSLRAQSLNDTKDGKLAKVYVDFYDSLKDENNLADRYVEMLRKVENMQKEA